ncbi:MAG: diguanylate cyclase (GGDEF)-like protein/PAS domain S-box-containing protein [Motiliproteus sp.]|jgi:diguanylate cyclase (GGDEF)-like protein/PAS domain S-box-containing protein
MLDISAVTLSNQPKSSWFEHLPLVIWVVDFQGIIIQVEGDGLDALGIAQGQWVGLSVLELFRGKQAELDGLHRAQQGEASSSRSRFKGRWFETHYSPLADAGGQVHAVCGISVDVTDKQNYEQQLAYVASGVSAETGEQFFKALTQHLVKVLDADLAFVGVLSADASRVDTREVFAGGISVDNFSYELAHTPCKDLLRDDHCCYPNDVHLAYPDDLLLEERGVRGYLGAVLKNAQGQPLGVLVVLYKQPMTDIPMAESLLRIFSVRAAAELERQAANEQLRVLSAVVEQSPASVMITDVNGLISYVNPAFTTTLGYSSQEVIGHTPRLMQSGDTPPQTYQQLWKTISSGMIWRGELINKTKSGEPVYESLIIAPIRDSAQHISHYVAIKENISPLKASEQQRRRTNRALRLLSECNQALIRSTDERQQLQRVCDILVDHGGYNVAWVGAASSAQAGLVTPQVHAGDVGSYLENIAEHLRGERLSGDCIRQNRAQIFHQLDSQSTTPLSYLPEGIRSAMALPMVSPEQGIYSVLWILSDQVDAFDALESGLLDELAEDMIFGLVAHRTRQALNDSEAKLRVLAEDSMVGIYMIQDGRFIYANPYMARLFGYDLELLCNGFSVRELVAPESRARVAENLRQRLEGEPGGQRYEFTGLSADGRRIQVEVIGNQTTFAGKPCIVGTLVDITQRRALEQQLQTLSNYDGLTGLANKNLLGDRLEQSLIHAGRSECHTALVMLDLDRFKMLNQSIGISATDTVLQVLAARLSQVVRQGDTLARLGADDFAIVLHDVSDLEDIAPVVRALMARVSEPLEAGPEGMALTCSVGVAVYPQDGMGASELLCNAEAALYNAKELRNSFRFYTPKLNERAMEQLALEVELSTAVERNEFELYYQAKVDLRSGKITGAEALIRWIHPLRGLVSPVDFIPAAEDTGLIIPMGAWAMQQACLMTSEINKRCGTQLSIAVNLSAKQFANEQLAAVIIEALQSTGLAPELLECELTESMLMADPDRALAVIQELKQLGIRVSLDDFGTGYSSLAYLKQFPIDTLKIDGSFIKDLPGDPQDRAISRAIIALAAALELYVVAEGVETQAQRQFLEAEHCDSMQGFLFSKPVPAREFEALVVLQQQKIF